jgi:hypothetical protein
MKALKTSEIANEKKIAEVRALLHNLAEMQRGMRNDSYMEKQRLSDESERLTREVAAPYVFEINLSHVFLIHTPPSPPSPFLSCI